MEFEPTFPVCMADDFIHSHSSAVLSETVFLSAKITHKSINDPFRLNRKNVIYAFSCKFLDVTLLQLSSAVRGELIDKKASTVVLSN